MTLEQALEENAGLKDELSRLEEELIAARKELEAKTREADGLGEELGRRPTAESVDELQEELGREKDRVKGMWRTNCEQLAYYDQELAAKDKEIAELRREAAAAAAAGSNATGTQPATTVLVTRTAPAISPTTSLSRATPPISLHPPVHSTPRSVPDSVSSVPPRRLGKAPPVDVFNGENLELRLEDWLPTLERVSAWNNWTSEELLIQFAGHLRGKAFQEWNLMGGDDKTSYESAVQALKVRLDPGAKTLAAQDFRHARQHSAESVGEFIRRLE